MILTGSRTFYCKGCFKTFRRFGHNEKIRRGFTENSELCDPCSLAKWGQWMAAEYRKFLDYLERKK